MITETTISTRVFGVFEDSAPCGAPFARTDRAVSALPRAAAAPKSANQSATDLSQDYVTDLGTSTKVQEPPRGAPR
ncbi:MAG: hypothetical protein ABI468_02540 [Candidatus Nanopelagicales bacterium]